jgi:Tfp pilus assembly protein PilF
MSTPTLVQQFYARIWEAGDLDAASELLAEDFVFRGSLGTELRGREAFESYVRSIRASLASILIAGAGGGYAGFGGLPLFFELRAAGKSVHLASLSFCYRNGLDGAEQNLAHPGLYAVTGRAATPTDPYASGVRKEAIFEDYTRLDPMAQQGIRSVRRGRPGQAHASPSQCVGPDEAEEWRMTEARDTRLERCEPVFHWWLRARDFEDEGKMAQALVCIERFRQVDPDSKLSNLMYGQILTGLRRFAEAEAALDRVLPLAKPGARGTAYHAWGELYTTQGKHAEAEIWYRRLAEVVPTQTAGWILLGSCLAQQGKLRAAEEIHRHASQLEGDPDEALLNLGLVLRAQGRLEEAATALRRALEFDPLYEAAQGVLEDVLAALALQTEPLEKAGSSEADVEVQPSGPLGVNAETEATGSEGE